MEQGKKHLLMIGIDKYLFFQQLNNAVKDVKDVEELLTKHYGFSDDWNYCRRLFNEDATRKNIIREFERLCVEVEEEDKLLIYFSGHGYLNPRNKLGYWITCDGEKEDRSKYVSNSEIHGHINAINSKHTLLISDSCFSGKFVQTRDPAAGADIPGIYKTWEEDNSRLVLFSGKEVVSDGKKGTNSPFAEAFLRQLRKPRKKMLNIRSMAQEISEFVSYNWEQAPDIAVLQGTGHKGGQFIFHPNHYDPSTYAETMENYKRPKQEKGSHPTRFSDEIAPAETLQNASPEILLAQVNEIRSHQGSLESSITQFLNWLDVNTPLGAPSSTVQTLEVRYKSTRRRQEKGTISKREFSELYEEHVEKLIFLLQSFVENKRKPSFSASPLERKPGQVDLGAQRILITQSEVAAVFDNLRELPDTKEYKSVQHNLTLLEGRYSRLNKEREKGVLRREDAEIEHNRIVQTLLSIIDKIGKIQEA